MNRIRITDRHDRRCQRPKEEFTGEWIAENIEFDEDVKGPLDEISGNVLSVADKTVNVTDDTRFDDD